MADAAASRGCALAFRVFVVVGAFHVFGAQLFYKLGRVSRLLQQYSRYCRPRMRRDRTRKYKYKYK